jgi:hypothetical protein
MKFYFLILLPIFCLLTGCPSPLISVEATDTRASHLTLKFLEGDTDKAPTIFNVSFFSQTRGITLWEIGLIDRTAPNPVKLSEITYGLIPNGFSGKPAIRLQPGETVEITVYAVGVSEPIILKLSRITPNVATHQLTPRDVVWILWLKRLDS